MLGSYSPTNYRVSIYKCVQILDDCANDEAMTLGNGQRVWLLRRAASERIRYFAPELMRVEWDVEPYRWYLVSRYIRSLHNQHVHEMMVPRQVILDQPEVLFAL